MTTDMMSLQALLEKNSDADLLREMIGFAAHRLMELEVENLTGAAHGERSADRITHRSGYRERDWETRPTGQARGLKAHGTVERRIPKLRRAATRSVDELVRIMTGISKSKELDAAAGAGCAGAAMIAVPSGVRVWLAVGRTDMRRGMNGLALQVQEALGRILTPAICTFSEVPGAT
jgi:hypothetical protein